jgi:hypothetical protein
MLPNIGKYVMATFFLILVYLILTNYKAFNSTITSFGNVTLRGIGVLQGRSKSNIVGV